VTFNPGSERERNLGKIDILTLDTGDVVEFETSGGGGFGEPLDREPARVLGDIASGLVSLEQAEADYGVVVRDGAVDEAATNELRAKLPRSAYPLVDVGAERRAYEAVWSDEVATELIALLKPFPSRLRSIVLAHTRKGVDELGRAPSPAELGAIVQEAARTLGVRRPEPVEVV
jgi:N-methylhydantoinase B